MNAKRLFVFLLISFCFTAIFAAGKHKYTLVIDAGHGGKDAGACANRAMEKNINLSVALAFGRYVEQNCPDVKVIYTRKTDVFIPLHERADIANRNKADVFVSIHTNSLPGKKPKAISGMETYTMGIRRSDEKLSAAKRENEVILIEKDYRQHYSGYDPHSPESMMIFEIMNETNMAESVELAQLIQQYTSKTAGRPNKGVRQDAFLVLRETSMPACLVELGYITTPAEAAYLTNKANVDRMGRGIYQAFVAFKNKKTGKPAPPLPAPVQEQTVQEPVEPTPDQTVTPAAPVARQEQPAVVQQEVPVEVRKEVVTETGQKSAETEQEISVHAGHETPVAAESQKTIANLPVFKVQLLVSDHPLKKNDAQLKGLKDVDNYKEGGLWKYTLGASTDYNKIYRLRKSVQDKFPQAFIIAFRNGEKIDAAKAYQEFKLNNSVHK